MIYTLENLKLLQKIHFYEKNVLDEHRTFKIY